MSEEDVPNLRPIRPLTLNGVVPNEDVGIVPEFRMVDPAKCYVDESYQRNLSRGSLRLITKIVKSFEYRNMKPPILVRYKEDCYKVIDGQHTLIAAITHPSVKLIPAFVYPEDVEVTKQAETFISHNQNRLSVSPFQLFHAKVVAKDASSVAIHDLVTSNGMRIPKSTSIVYEVGDFVALYQLEKDIARYSFNQIDVVLALLGRARLAPVNRSYYLALMEIVWGSEYRSKYSIYDIETAFRSWLSDYTSSKTPSKVEVVKGIIRWLQDNV